MKRIFLIGPPGSGKTACGQELARLLGCMFYDTDALIEAKVGCSIKQLFETRGEAYFRQLEKELLDELPSGAPDDDTVVFATGGGLPIYNNNLQRLEQLGKVVALSAALPVLVERVRNNTARPLLASESQDAHAALQQRLSELIEKRSPLYEQAGYKIDTSGLKPDEVAHEIIRVLYSTR